MSYVMDVLAAAGCALPPGAHVLDLGCGEGMLVAQLRHDGWDAHGCDLAAESALSPGSREHGWKTETSACFGTTETARSLAAAGLLRPIRSDPYRLPYEDSFFDAVLTNQVFEHVMNVDETLAEIRRVLKPGGVTLHFFPARYRPIEVHVFVPFGGVLRHPWWLSLWARCGVRNSFQAGLPAAEVARRNREYLISSTLYASPREIRRSFSRHFGRVVWVEEAALRVSPNRKGRLLHAVGRHVPGAFILFRLTRENILLAADPLPRKPGSTVAEKLNGGAAGAGSRSASAFLASNHASDAEGGPAPVAQRTCQVPFRYSSRLVKPSPSLSLLRSAALPGLSLRAFSQASGMPSLSTSAQAVPLASVG